MKALRLLAAYFLLAVPFAAHADRPRLPADAPPAFQAECASCHVAFPPRLLTAGDWRQVMAKLDRHYGDNASLDERTRFAIEDFLARNAGSERKLGAGGAAAGEPPRLTATAWFRREHRESRLADWNRARPKSLANCAACHAKAAQGSYREREIVMPDGRKWED